MPRIDWVHLFVNRRMAVLLGLGFAAGLPLNLTDRTMRVWAIDQGVDLPTVGLFTLLTLPYTLKFLWAPVMDRYSPPGFGRRRGWLLITQLLVALAIAGMAVTGPRSPGDPLVVFAVMAAAVAFFSASQDIVADAYRTDILAPVEFGIGASTYMTGYRLAMLAFSAGAVMLADHLPWKSVYLLAAACMAVGVVSTVFARTPPSDSTAPSSLWMALDEPIHEFLTRNGRRAAMVLIFIVTFKLPDYMAGTMNDALLLNLGFTKSQIAIWSLGVGTAVTIPGVLAGGVITVKLGLFRALLIFGVAQAVSNAGYLTLAQVGPVPVVMWAAVAIEYFCTGLVVAGFVAFLMSLCDKRFSATQYALLSGLMGLSRHLAAAPSGYIVEHVGYRWFFIISIAAAVPGMLILTQLRGLLAPARVDANTST